MWHLFGLILSTLLVGVDGQGSTTVNTKHGPVNGHIVTLSDGRAVRSFLGIPFAKPPNGTLRFMVRAKMNLLSSFILYFGLL